MFYKIGHRGASGYEKENTLASFQKALSLGADIIEMDIHICQTGEPIVIHDKEINRLSQQKGLVKDKSLTELKELGFFSLADILEVLPSKTNFNIELKEKEAVKPVIQLLEYFIKMEKFSINNFLISSFDYPTLKKFYSLMPQIKLGLLIPRSPLAYLMKYFPFFSNFYVRRAQKIQAYSIHLFKKNVNSEITNIFHHNGFKVFVFTTNKLSEIKRIKAMGADGIFSDYPDRL